MHKTRWLSIDPGLRRTGWAYWNGDQLAEWGLITSADMRETGWELKSQVMADRVYNKSRYYNVSLVISECPQEMAGGRGEMSLRSGSVRKLAFYVGMIGGMVLSPGCRFDTVEPMKWKGQLPKEITQKRVLRDFPQVPNDLYSDVYDAIGIGRWRLRELKKRGA